MTNTAEILPQRPKLELVKPLPSAKAANDNIAVFPAPQLAKADKEIFILAALLALFQIADGVLTGIGVHHLGIEMEANPLLRSMMLSFGTVFTLVLVKSFAIGIVGFLTTFANTVSWLIYAMRGMAVLYACAAIVPWSAILIGYFS